VLKLLFIRPFLSAISPIHSLSLPPAPAHTHTLTPIAVRIAVDTTLFFPHTHALPRAFTILVSQFLSLTHTLKCNAVRIAVHKTFSRISLAHPSSLSHTQCLTHSLPNTLSLIHTHSLSLSLTHTHTLAANIVRIAVYKWVSRQQCCYGHPPGLLQCVATVLQPCCSALQPCCSALQPCFSALQCGAVLQSVALCCNVLQYVAVCCNKQVIVVSTMLSRLMHTCDTNPRFIFNRALHQ